MPSYEFAAFVDSLPDDLHGFNEFLQSLSAAERAAFDARLAAPAAESETGPSATGAFFGELGFQLGDLGASETPYLGQGKAAAELITGKNVRGEELGWLGRAAASIDLLPGGGIIRKAAEGIGAVAKGAADAAGAVAKLGRKADDVTGAAKFAAPKAAVAKLEGHHSDPKFLGGDPKQKLTTLPKPEHADLHGDLNEFLREKMDAAGNHMRPQRGNPGSKIREKFTRRERLEATAEFYKKFRDKYPDAARDFFEQHPGLE